MDTNTSLPFARANIQHDVEKSGYDTYKNGVQEKAVVDHNLDKQQDV